MTHQNNIFILLMFCFGHFSCSNSSTKSVHLFSQKTIDKIHTTNSRQLKSLTIDDNKIIGGVEANLQEFLSIISLQYISPSGTHNHTCTGSIVNQNWIITAAHCSKGIGSVSNYRVVAGVHNLYDFRGTEQIRSVKQIKNHPLYLMFSKDYDISMMMVNQSFEFNDNVAAVRLPEENYTAVGNGIAAGWGLTNKNATNIPSKLQKTILPFFNFDQCQAMYSDTGSDVTSRMLCAGGEKDRNVCHRDSGGPFYSKTDKDSMVLSGLTSWGYACADPGWPSVFTNVSYFRSWIDCVASYESPLSLIGNLFCI